MTSDSCRSNTLTHCHLWVKAAYDKRTEKMLSHKYMDYRKDMASRKSIYMQVCLHARNALEFRKCTHFQEVLSHSGSVLTEQAQIQ